MDGRRSPSTHPRTLSSRLTSRRAPPPLFVRGRLPQVRPDDVPSALKKVLARIGLWIIYENELSAGVPGLRRRLVGDGVRSKTRQHSVSNCAEHLYG